MSEDGFVIVIKPKDRAGLDRDAACMKPPHRLLVSGNIVVPLICAVQTFLRNGLQPHEQRLAPASGGKLQKLIIEGHVECRLAGPPPAQRRNCAEQFLGIFAVGADVIVPKHERPSRHPPHLVTPSPPQPPRRSDGSASGADTSPESSNSRRQKGSPWLQW